MITLLKRWSGLVILLVLHLAVLLHYGVAPGELARFLLAITFFAFLPGLLLLECLHMYEDDGYRLVLALIAGIILDILIYIAAAVLGWWWLFNLGAGLVLLALLAKKSLRSDLNLLVGLPGRLPRLDLTLLSFLSLLLLGLLVVFQYIPNPLPGGSSPLIYYIDQTWHLGNIAEINNHWPPQDPRLAGHPFQYHIFVYILMASWAKVTGIALPVLYFRLGPWLLLSLLFAAAYFVGCRWFRSRSAGWLHVTILFFMGTLLLSYPYNIFLTNLFTSPTFLLATIFTLALLLEFKIYMGGGAPHRLALILLLVTGLSGAKGNFFPVLYGGLLSCGLINRLRSQPEPRLFILLATTIVPFGLVFTYIFKSGGSEGINIVPLEIIRYTQLHTSLAGWLGQEGAWLAWCLLPVYLVAFLSLRLPVLANLLRQLTASGRRLGFEPVFMAATIGLSFLAGLLLSYRGRSEYFFLFIGLICLNLLASGYLLESYTSHRSRWLQVVMTILVLLAGADTALTVRHLPQMMPELAVVSYQPLTPQLHEALLFLRENSRPDALVGSCRAHIYSPDDARFFYYSAFAERRMLVEGWGYMGADRQAEARNRYADMVLLYQTHDANLAASIIDKYQLDYIIVENQINQHLWFDWSDFLRLRFENRAVEIYETI